MTAGEALREYLSRQEPVTSLVGNRIYGDKAEADKGAYIVYTMQANEEPGHLTGVSGVARATMQVNCWSRKKPESEQIRNAVRNVLQTFRGKIGTFSVRSARILNSADAFLPDEDGSSTGDYSAGVTLSVWYRIAAPSAV
jgi:hypothetical protein